MKLSIKEPCTISSTYYRAHLCRHESSTKKYQLSYMSYQNVQDHKN